MWVGRDDQAFIGSDDCGDQGEFQEWRLYMVRQHFVDVADTQNELLHTQPLQDHLSRRRPVLDDLTLLVSETHHLLQLPKVLLVSLILLLRLEGLPLSQVGLLRSLPIAIDHVEVCVIARIPTHATILYVLEVAGGHNLVDHKPLHLIHTLEVQFFLLVLFSLLTVPLFALLLFRCEHLIIIILSGGGWS